MGGATSLQRAVLPGDRASVRGWRLAAALTFAFVVTRVLVVATTCAGATHVHGPFARPWAQRPAAAGPAPSAALDPLVRWDALYYTALARKGYPPARRGPVYHVAFFPLYPLLVRGVPAPSDDFLRAVCLSNLLALLATFAIAALAEAEGGHGLWAGLWFLAAPGANFLAYPYGEALFALLVAAGLLWIRLGKPFHAGVAGALAGTTRAPGLAVALALGVDALRFATRSKRAAAARLASAALAGTGVLAFALFLGHRYGDPFAFSTIQAAWGRSLSLLGPVRALFGFHSDPDYYLVALVAIGVAVVVTRRLSAPSAAAMWALLLLPIATGTLKSIIRFESVNVPLLCGASRLGSRRAQAWALGVSLLLLAFEAWRYGAGYGNN